MSAIAIKNLFYRFKFDPELVPHRKAYWISAVEIRVYEDQSGGFTAIDVFGVPPGTNGQPDSQGKLGLVTANPLWLSAKLDELIKVHNLTDVQAALNEEEQEA